MPYALEGYWTVPLNTSREGVSAHASLAAVQYGILEGGGDPAGADLERTGTFVACLAFSDITHCPGGDLARTAYCKDGYDGVACDQCAADYFRFFGECHACDGGWKVRGGASLRPPLVM